MGVVAGGMVVIVYLAVFAILGLCYAVIIADYVMSSIALKRIATRRGIEKPWLAWIPVARDMVFGSLLDVDDAKKGVQRNWKKVFLILSIAAIGIMVIAYVCLMGIYIVMFAAAAAETEEMMALVIFPFLIYYILIIVGALLSGALNACRMLSVFKIFEATVPEKVVKYFLLYLMVPVAGSLCLLKCKDQGCLEADEPILEEVQEEPEEI